MKKLRDAFQKETGEPCGAVTPDGPTWNDNYVHWVEGKAIVIMDYPIFLGKNMTVEEKVRMKKMQEELTKITRKYKDK